MEVWRWQLICGCLRGDAIFGLGHSEGNVERPRPIFPRSTRKSGDIYRGLNHLLQSVIAKYGVWNFQLAKWRSIMNMSEERDGPWPKLKNYVGQSECPREPESQKF